MDLKLNLNKYLVRLSLKEKMLFAKHMAIMTGSGMQMLESIQVLRSQTTSKSLQIVLDQLMEDVRNGQFLSTSLERYKHIFNDFFINVIRVGEASGTLSDNFKYLADELKKQQELNRKIKGAMIYPIIIVVATVGITSLMTFFIFPKILPVLKSINVELPATTRGFIKVSDFMFNYGSYVIGGFVAFLIGLWFILRIGRVRFIWHKIILNLPLVNNMSRAINMIKFSRTLALLLKSDVKIVESLNITADTLTNLVYRQAVKETANRVQMGDLISKYLKENPHLFPTLMSQMISVGENTGKLDESALYLADFYEGELDETTKALSNALEPILLVVMGLIVGFVALAIITPIYKITETLTL
ncbi:MAG: type II secretion system F family protein [bacterium]|nr:type II secretion system F family protein [bacterium]